MANEKRTAFTVGQLAKRWSVSEARVRALIESGVLNGAFTIPSAGRFGETTKIPIDSVLTAERTWAVTAAVQKPRQRHRANPVAAFKHFPELIDDQEPCVESHEGDPS